MSMTCTVCRSSGREAVDESLADGDSLRSILERFSDLSMGALHRHASRCVAADLQIARQSAAVRRGVAVHESLRRLLDEATALVNDSRDGGVPERAAALRELRGALTLAARISGALRTETTAVQVNVSRPSRGLNRAEIERLRADFLGIDPAQLRDAEEQHRLEKPKAADGDRQELNLSGVE